jgi:2-methylcitrate dehydratase PrpD
MKNTGATHAVLDFIQSARLEMFPDEVAGLGKRCILDGIAVILAGSGAECSNILRKQAERLAGNAEASIIGGDFLRVPAATAALLHGTSGHALDYDDTQLSNSPDRIFGLLTHPTVPVLSATLAIGEKLAVRGREALEAFLIGLEVECKIAEAINPDHYRRGFHSSGTIGTFGAVASAIKLEGLDREAAAHAIGIAASLSGGIRANFGTMTKPLHVGRAAQNGVTAAELASLGYTADSTGLDGAWGFFQVMGGGFDEKRIVGRLGSPHSIIDPGVSVKPYPCGCLGHPTMDAMLALVEENDIKPEQVERILVRAGANILEPLRYRRAADALEAKFCIPFMVSSIALRRKAGIREFTDDFVASEAVQEMMKKVEVVRDIEIEKQGFDQMRSVVEVDLKQGEHFAQPAPVYRGGPERPFTREQLHEKFDECAEPVLSRKQIEKAIDTIESLEELQNLADLIGILRKDISQQQEGK